MLRQVGRMIGAAVVVGLPVGVGVVSSGMAQGKKNDDDKKQLKWQDTCTRAIRASRSIQDFHDEVVRKAPVNGIPSMDKLFFKPCYCKERRGQELTFTSGETDTRDLPCTMLKNFLTLVEKSIKDAPDSAEDHPAMLANLMKTYYYVRLGEIQSETGIEVPFYAIETTEKARNMLIKIDPRFRDIHQLQVRKQQEADEDGSPD